MYSSNNVVLCGTVVMHVYGTVVICGTVVLCGTVVILCGTVVICSRVCGTECFKFKFESAFKRSIVLIR